MLGEAAQTRRSVDESVRRSETQWIDLARIIAIGAVVMIHVIGPVVSGTPMSELDHPRWWLGNVLDAVCRAAVPVFVMLSGALLLAPTRMETVSSFYRRRLRRIGVPLIFWSLLYVAHAVLTQGITLWGAARRVALGVPFFHLYFLFILLGLYAATPFLRLVLNSLDKRGVTALCILLLSLGAVNQVFAAFFDAGRLNAITYFVPYMGYYLAGHVLCQAPRLRDGQLGRAGLVFALSTALTASGTWLLAREHGWSAKSSYLYDYLSPTVILASLAAFVLLRALPERLAVLTRPSVVRRVQTISALTFGVYLVHPLLMQIPPAFDVHPSRAPALLVASSAYWVLLIAASLMVVAAARRIPLLRRAL